MFARVRAQCTGGLRRLCCSAVTVHGGIGRPGGGARKRTPHATLHGRGNDVRQRQWSEDRDEHNQQRESGCPAVHYLFARFKYGRILHADCANHTIGGGAKASADSWEEQNKG